MPFDIIDAILGELNTRGDVETLRNCAVLSRSLLQPARRRLFSTITLYGGGGSSQRLHALLLKDPRLLTYFRTLEIPDLPWWPEENPALHLLCLIAEKAVLRSISFDAPRICWAGYFSKLQPVLSQILKSPLLHTVRIINICISFPLEYLGMSPRLRHLAFSCQVRSPSDAESLRVTTPPPPLVVETPLESLHIGQFVPEQLVKYLTTRCNSGISRLRELSIDSLEPDTMNAASQVLQQAKDTLESLIFIDPSYLPRDSNINNSKLDYRSLPHLRFMTFYIIYPGVFRFRLMVDILSEYGLPRTVEGLTIVLELKAGIGDSDDILEEISDGISCVSADSALAGACLGRESSMLKQVEIVLLINSEEVNFGDFEEGLPLWLPSLHDAGLLVASTASVEDKWKVLTSLSIASRS